jgi:hypothetical protein
MKKLLFIPILLLTVFSCADTTKKEEKENSLMDQSYFRHLSYLIKIKNEVAQEHWPAFAKKEFFQPIVYYSGENTFVLSPNEHIRKITDHREVESFKKVPVIKLPDSYTDTTSLKFHTSVTSDTTTLSYKQPTLYFQSFELTKKFLQDDLVDLQDWSIMVIHELFHGFQWSIPEMVAFSKSMSIPGGPDEFLGSYHRDLEWYKKSVHEENDLLKAIWIDGVDLNENLTKYDSLRTKRIERIKREFDVDIRDVEDYEITIEGNARYFESLIKRYLSKNTPSTASLTKEDQAGITGMFQGYDVSKDKNLYDVYNNRYWYQIGYNISMILEKYNVDYKNSIYSKEHSIHQFLEEIKNSQQ